jgi:hypothetical protein
MSAQVYTPPSLASDTALAKKRQFAEERAARLRDPRQRCMGIDQAALSEQVRERRALEGVEKDREQYFALQAVTMDQHAVALQREADTLRREREKDMVDFRGTFQKRELAREWDLNDPARLKTDLPARVHDADPRCSTSSLQKFEGEDLDRRNRLRAQQDQMRTWTEQQVDEKNMRKWMERDHTRQYEDRAEDMAFRTYQIESNIAQQRRQVAVNNAEFNRALTEQKRREKLAERHNNTRKNLAEIENLINSDMLTEDPPTTHGPDFKGMTLERRAAVQAEQESQRQQRAQARAEADAAERQRDAVELNQIRMATLLDRQRERERREERKQIGEERLRQAGEAQERKQTLDKVYENAISDEYFVYGKCL